MPKFEGCIEAKEISLCPVKLGGGANQHAHVLMLKSKGGPPAEAKPEKKTMPQTAAEKTAAEKTTSEIQKAALAITNKIAAMSDVTKAHYLALNEDEQLAFLEKTAEERDKIAATAKEAADKATAEAEAAKTGKSVREVELEKRVATQGEEIEALKARDVEREIEKRADTEFAGYPGGSAAVVPLLKAYAKLPEDVRKQSEEILKAQCKTVSVVTRAFGAPTEADVSKATAAKTRVTEAAKKYAVDNKCTEAVALEKVSEMREFADDIAAMEAAG